MAIKMLRSRLETPSQQRVKPITTATKRMTGRSLQTRRLNIWKKDPTCKECKRLVAYPGGFELDHIIPLWEGGSDDDSNCQILCIWRDEKGDKQGCHAKKSAREASEREGGVGNF